MGCGTTSARDRGPPVQNLHRRRGVSGGERKAMPNGGVVMSRCLGTRQVKLNTTSEKVVSRLELSPVKPFPVVGSRPRRPSDDWPRTNADGLTVSARETKKPPRSHVTASTRNRQGARPAGAGRVGSVRLTVLSANTPTIMLFVSGYSSSPYFGPSRARPDSLTPPPRSR
jgi:hypothetical protein